MELLAPVGSFAAFEAALEEGANAVYIGAPELNARALSRDFSYAEIKAMVTTAHQSEVKAYIAMNSLVKENELGKAVEGLASFAAIGPDALIIQDMGLFRLARMYFPDLPLHASTLMGVHNSPGVRQLAELGFKRIVLPRELTIEEIAKIYADTGAELEVFVHGAMCFSYSGLCLFSSLHGGKSSLRGQCVQPCRRRYSWQKKNVRPRKGGTAEKGGGYLFSMHDLSGIDLLPELRRAGVASLKIEGRMKSAEYVRKTVRAYRLLLDSSAHNEKPEQRLLNEAHNLLDEAMGRKRTAGFFLDRHPGEAVSPHLSGNIGIMVGKVQRLEEQRAGGTRVRSILTVRLRQDIHHGDRLRLHDEQTGERTSFTLQFLQAGNRKVQHGRSGQNVTIIVDQQLVKGRRKVFQGSLFKVDVSSRRKEEQEARSRLLGPGGGKVQLDRQRIDRILREITPSMPGDGTNRPDRVRKKAGRIQWWVQVRSLQERHLRLPVAPVRHVVPLNFENIEYLKARAIQPRAAANDIIWSLPPIILDEDLPWHSEAIAYLVREGWNSFQLGHFTQRGLFASLPADPGRISLYGCYTFNILNSMTVAAMAELGFSALQFSIETDRENLASSLHNFTAVTEKAGKQAPSSTIGLYVYGRPALFTARLDDRRYQYGKRFVSPRGETFILDRKGKLTCARSAIPFSLVQWRKELAALGIDYFVVDMSEGNSRKNAADFIGLLQQKGRDQQVLEGNFLGGLL